MGFSKLPNNQVPTEVEDRLISLRYEPCGQSSCLLILNSAYNRR